MQPSALFCRTQEAQQRTRAADARLDNVRDIATNAANAWGKEAVLAERRESRATRAPAAAEDAISESGPLIRTLAA